MESKQCGRDWILRIDRGEEIVTTLLSFCTEKGIRCGSITGIGATDRVRVGLFRTDTKEYVSTELTGDHEITSLVGNVSTMDGACYLHLHVTLADGELRALGGHLSSAVVSGTCEVVLHPIEADVDRVFDEEVGLNLLKL